jgi:hypothetical protein
VTDLLSLTAELRERLPTDEQVELVFDTSNLPDPPAELAAPTLVMESGGRHVYTHVTYEMIEFFASRETYRALGVLVLACVLHQKRTRLDLRGGPHGPSVGEIVTTLEVDGVSPGAGANRLSQLPSSFEYWPRPDRGRLPFHDEHLDERDTPALGGPQDWELDAAASADKQVLVKGFGSMTGTANLACLFLDIGLAPQNGNQEFCLEAPIITGGVAADSAEARFWVGYDYVN